VPLAFALRRFPDYQPQRVTIKSLCKWLVQFEAPDRPVVLELLQHITYVSAADTKRALLEINSGLFERFEANGVPLANVIYVQFADAGSSSGLMLNMLRDGALLEQKRCRFLDGNDVRGLSAATNELGNGAIVYVDDFSGTGNQFCKARDFVVEHIVGNFSEFFLLPWICEEALVKLRERGVEPFAHQVHYSKDRILHVDNSQLDSQKKARLLEISAKIDKRWGLGYRNLATTVVFYRNAPNTVPLILRGNPRQEPWLGILPRTTDLP